MSRRTAAAPLAATGRPRRMLLGLSPVTVAALIWLVIIVLAVISAPLIARQGPNVQDLAAAQQLPSAAHWLGTDALGRDILSRLLYGGRLSLAGMIVGVAVAMVLGVSGGIAAGYLGRVVDRTLSFAADLLMSVPSLLVLLVAAAIIPNSTIVSMVIFGFFASAAIYRIIRGATLSIASELFITAAQATGLTRSQILWRHVAPRIGGVIRVQASVIAAITLVTQVGLGFLGLDAAPPAPNWGGMIADASSSMYTDLWQVVPPAVVVCVTILAFGVLGDVRSRAAAAGVSSSAGRSRHKTSANTASAPTSIARSAAEPVVSGALLSVRGVSVDVSAGGERLPLLDKVSFEIDTGEILGIVGESGAGKSVLVRTLLALDELATVTGTVCFRGRDMLRMSKHDLHEIRGKQIAFIGQDPMACLDPLFTVKSQLVEAIRTHRSTTKIEATQIARELLEDVRIPDADRVLDRYPSEISGGMAQRIAIALALAGNPRLLIADEPTTALDVTVQMEILGLLRSLRRERGLAIIIVTHDWGVVADICDRAVTLYAGEIVEHAQVQAIFDEPRHPYTIALRRSDPHLQPVGQRLRSIEGSVPPPGSWPAGCRFADRCSFVTPHCRSAHPELVVAAPDHLSRCIRVAEIAEPSQESQRLHEQQEEIDA